MQFIEINIPEQSRSNFNKSTTSFYTTNSGSISTVAGYSADYLNLILSNKYPTYAGIVLGSTSNLGGHGSITGDSAVYFMNSNGNFIWKNGVEGITGNTMSLDNAGNLYVTGNIIAGGEISAYGAGSLTGSSGSGLINSVYDSTDLTGNTFNDNDYTNTFNAYTIKLLNDKVAELQVQINSKVQDKFFKFEQGVPSSIWNITHNLGKNPAVTIVDSANTTVIGAITYNNANSLTVTFSAGFSGTAFLN